MTLVWALAICKGSRTEGTDWSEMVRDVDLGADGERGWVKPECYSWSRTP